jgi:UDP-glucuronate decarboxylase
VNPIGPRACYDEGKRAAETLFFEYHRLYGVRIKVARIFNTYGPRMDKEDGRVVSNFIAQALEGSPITLYGEGLQTRSFCYVDDTIKAIRALMASEDSFTGPVNLGNPAEYTIVELASIILQMTNSTSAIHFMPLPIDDPKKRQPDITLAMTHLGWQPKTTLKDGLRATINYSLIQVQP